MMHKYIFTCLLLCALALGVQAQASANFEDLGLPQDTFLNGSDQSGGFSSGGLFFPNVYSPDFGGFWVGGWALSSMRDTATASFTNLYSARSGGGAAGSATYAVGQQGAVVRFGQAGAMPVSLAINNGTYPHGSMLNGDSFAKKFGGATGDDPDFFKLAIFAYRDGVLATDSIEFYLADYRFADNSLDYIVSEWTTVDLSALGSADSLLFVMSSSDVGDFGINTPLFFCMDELRFEVTSRAGGAAQQGLALRAAPNPVQWVTTVSLPSHVLPSGMARLFAADGRLVAQVPVVSSQIPVDMSHLPSGVYLLQWQHGRERGQVRLVKQ